MKVFTTVLLLFGFTGFAVAQPVDDSAAKCSEMCKDPVADPTKKDLIFGGERGELISGQTTFQDAITLRVIVRKNNPFRYDYKFGVRIEDINRANVLGLLGIIPGASDLLSPAGFLPAPPKPQDTAPTLLPTLAEFATLSQRFLALESARGNLVKLITERKGDAKLYNEFVKAIDAESQPTMSELCISGRKLQPRLKTLSDFSRIDPEKKTLDDGAPFLDTAFTALEEAVQAKISAAGTSEADKTKWAAELQAQRDSRDKLKQGIEAVKKEYDTVVGGLKQEKGNIDKLTARVDLVFNNPSAFVEIVADNLNLQKGQAFTVSGTRVNVVTGQEEGVSGPTGQSGDSTIHFSAGIGFSTIDDVKIIRQQGLAADGKTVESKFGFEANSNFKPSAVAMLNVPLKTFKGVSIGPAAGIVVSGRGGTAEAEFIAGPSFGFASDIVFLTFGFHAARVQQLGSNFKIGDKVPDGLTDPLPIQKNFKAGLMISLTFKLR